MNKKRILIIDDDQTVANIYQTKFQVEGFDVEVSVDGPGGLEALRKTPADVVLLDFSLPGMNGVEVLKQIRSRPDTKDLPVIFFSNTYLTSVMQSAWKAGATKCLSKGSSTPREVLEIAKKILIPARPPQSAAAPGAIRLAVPLTLGKAAPERADEEFQAGLVSDFLASAPLTIAAMRDCYQTFLKPEHADLRLANLDKLCRFTRVLTAAAGVVDFKKIAQMASALEAFVEELRAHPADITPSTIRTIAQAVDKLALLVARSSTPTTHAETPEAPLILVVDDEAVSREIIVRAITKAGLRAMSLDNSTLALQVLEQNHFDLIFMDIKMPKPDGLEACKLIREMPLNRTTPVVFITAKADFESRVKSSSSGGSDFIAKPILVLELAVKALTWLHNEDLKPLGMAGSDGRSAKLKAPKSSSPHAPMPGGVFL